MSDILERILEQKRREVTTLPPTGVALEASPPRGFRDRLARPGLGVIAEVKRRSPSAGTLRAELDPVALATTYESCGAAAVSVLTDAPFFHGSFEDLARVRRAIELPVLCKDFVVDVRQVFHARRNGADAVLLIVRALEPSQIDELAAAAGELGMDVLVEVHDRAELDVALRAGAELVGVNNRNLDTFEIDLATTVELRPHVPSGVVLVSESGIDERAHVDRVRAQVDAVLVGTALVRSADVPARFEELFS